MFRAISVAKVFMSDMASGLFLSHRKLARPTRLRQHQSAILENQAIRAEHRSTAASFADATFPA
jgi:hypothetical protein